MNPEPSELELLRATHAKWHKRIRELERENRSLRARVAKLEQLLLDELTELGESID